MIKVTFPDGNIKEFEEGISVLDIAQSISPALKREVLCARVNDEIVDIRTKLNISKKSSNNFTDTEVTRIVIGYMNELVSIQDYCKQIQISRYQFNSLVKKYDKLFPKQQIQQLVINHSNAVQKYKIQQKAENEKLN